MTEAVIVSTARTPIGKAFRGVQHDAWGDAGRPCCQHAVERAGIDPGEIDDVVLAADAGKATGSTSRGSRRSAPGCR